MLNRLLPLLLFIFLLPGSLFPCTPFIEGISENGWQKIREYQVWGLLINELFPEFISALETKLLQKDPLDPFSTEKSSPDAAIELLISRISIKSKKPHLLYKNARVEMENPNNNDWYAKVKTLSFFKKIYSPGETADLLKSEKQTVESLRDPEIFSSIQKKLGKSFYHLQIVLKHSLGLLQVFRKNSANAGEFKYKVVITYKIYCDIALFDEKAELILVENIPAQRRREIALPVSFKIK
ncbi:hypothetical protein ACFL35_02330 [Candidatus Riflebacteria bacterium]